MHLYSSDGIDWHADADVLVLGGGAAGLFAAIEAAEMGASTILLESEPAIGGSSRLSGGYVVLCETELEPGNRRELLEDFDDAHHHDSHFELSRVYVDSAADTYLRLKELGVEFVGTMQFAHMSRPWAHEPGGIGGGAEIVACLERAAVRREVRIVLASRAVSLLQDGTGRVIGVAADGPAGRLNYRARKAVVLASGGFTRNPELIRQYGRLGADKFVPLTGKGSLGDGLKMGLSVAAATSYLEIGVAPTVPVDPEMGSATLVNYKGAILVNKEGRRFCRESDVYLDLSWAGVHQTQELMIQVYDSAIRKDYLDWHLSSLLGLCPELSAPTLEALGTLLGERCGVDGSALVATVNAYNHYAVSGRDPDHGRIHLVGTAGSLRKIHHAPFFAVVLKPGTTHFNGGLRVNRNMQVLDVAGDAIKGLYAAGEVTGGFHGSGYMSGSFLGSALIFGRIAGKNAADERRAWSADEKGAIEAPAV